MTMILIGLTGIDGTKIYVNATAICMFGNRASGGGWVNCGSFNVNVAEDASRIMKQLGVKEDE